MSGEFKSVSEAAQQLGVSSRRVRQLIEDGELPAQRIGNSWAIPVPDIYRRGRRSPTAGRPYEQKNLWKLAALADGIAHVYAHEHAEDRSLGENQNRLASELTNVMAELSSLNVREVVDNPTRLAELQNLLSRAESLARREEFSASWMRDAADRLRHFESKAEMNSLAMSKAWLYALNGSEEVQPNPRLLRNLRNMLGCRLAHREVNIGLLRSRFDQSAFFYVHPSLVDDVMDDFRLAHSGDRAAAHYGLDLIPGDGIDAYVRSDQADSVVDDHSLQEADSSNGNVILRLVQELPENHPQAAPRLFVAADLLEEDDPRRKEAGSKLIDALAASICLHQLLSQWK